MAIVNGLEIRDSSGALLGVVDSYYDASWDQGVNVADCLTFSLPTEDADLIAIDNQVWLRRGDAGSLARKFVIRGVTTRRGKRLETSVEAYDYACLLMDVPVASYPDWEVTTPEGYDEPMVPASTYLNGLLARASATGITWGTLPEAVGYLKLRDVILENSNVWAGLQNARQDIGGMLWVDNDKSLHWYVDRFPNPGKTFSLEIGRNLISVERAYTTLGTSGRTSYKIEAIDLSAHDDADDGMWMIGMPVTVDMPDETTQELLLTSITQSLDSPLRIQASVSTTLNGTGRFRDLLDDIVELFDHGGSLATNKEEAWKETVEERVDTITERIVEIETGVTGVQPGTDIQDVGTTNAPGDNPEFARDDHVHALTAATVAEAITDGETDDITEAIAEIITDDDGGAIAASLPYGTDIQSVGISNSPGELNEVARVDHVHQGESPELVAALPEIPTDGSSRVVRWGTEDDISGGTGDGQLWETWDGADRWYPRNMYTDLSGFMGET
jgi:hypothetical protein